MTAIRAIDRKLLRDLRHLSGPALAIVLVLASGVATFTTGRSMIDALSGTLDRYYATHRFGHLFARLERAPNALLQRIEEVPGVAEAEGRVLERLTLSMPGLVEPASAWIVSLPEDPAGGLNRVHLRSGRLPVGRDRREVLVGEAFAEAHGLQPGDSVEAVLNGRLQRLAVVGVALSPEFIYLIAPGSLFPDNARFGTFWMGREEMEAAYDVRGAFNDLVLRLDVAASEREVVARIDALTAAYGGLGAHGRGEQPSHQFVANELKQLRTMAILVPLMFLGVAAFLVDLVLGRLVTTQREQIAALKALGYGRLELARHYLGFALVIAVAGGGLGLLLGAAMGRGMTGMYADFFRFPAFSHQVRPSVALLGFAIAFAAAAFGVMRAVLAAVRLPAAEAMRPQPPVSFRPTILERAGLHRMLPATVRMVVRRLERRPAKTLLSCLGIALGAAILVVGAFMEDAIDFVIDFQFARVQRYDMDVVLTDPTDDRAVGSLRAMPGVIACESYRAIPVRLRGDHHARRLGVVGIERSDGLFNLLDQDGVGVPIPPEGIVLSRTLANALRVAEGDHVRVEHLAGRRASGDVVVTGLADDFSGLAAYMDLEALGRLTGEPGVVGGAWLAVDPAQGAELHARLREAPRVVAVNLVSATREGFRETMGKNIGVFRAVLVGFASIIAVGVVYNSARIALAEQERELATLRVLGFSRAEVSVLQLGELGLLVLLAVPGGLLLGYGLAALTSHATASELVRIPFIVSSRTFVVAATVIVASAAISGLLVRRRLDRIDLVSALKAAE